MNITQLISEIRLTEPVDPKLFSETAEQAALELCSHKGRENASSQIRRFYDELVMWDEKLNAKQPEQRETAFREFMPYIQMIRAKLAYSQGRGLISKDFNDVFSHLIKEIKDPSSLKNAKLFFEAFLGFNKAINPNN